MTLAEYGAWFEGFSQTMPCPPGEAHWRKIKARVAEVDGMPIDLQSAGPSSTPTLPTLHPDMDTQQLLKELGRADGERLISSTN